MATLGGVNAKALFQGEGAIAFDNAGVLWATKNKSTASNTIGGTGWFKVIHNGNVLGTVSQSVGVPTGAVLERGSNANGEYVKWADGTLICTRNGIVPVLPNTSTIATGVTAPVSFTALDCVTAQVGFIDLVTTYPKTFSGPTAYGITTDSPASSSFYLGILSNELFTQANCDTTRFGYMAIGRWY